MIVAGKMEFRDKIPALIRINFRLWSWNSADGSGSRNSTENGNGHEVAKLIYFIILGTDNKRGTWNLISLPSR